MIIDAHSHLFDKPFDNDREEVIARMRAADVATITVGTSYAESVKAIEMAEHLGMWATVGQHPTDTFEEFDIEKYKKLCENKAVVGIGECGLDYVQLRFSSLPIEEEKARQKKLFDQHIELAQEVGKPLMLHMRDEIGKSGVYEEALGLIPEGVRAHFHFFSGDWAVAQKCLERGFTLSFPGTITFTSQYDEVVKNVPADMYTIETDSPYVLPEPYRSQAKRKERANRNEPVFVQKVAEKVAQIRGISAEEVARESTATARRVFGLL